VDEELVHCVVSRFFIIFIEIEKKDTSLICVLPNWEFFLSISFSSLVVVVHVAQGFSEPCPLSGHTTLLGRGMQFFRTDLSCFLINTQSFAKGTRFMYCFGYPLLGHLLCYSRFS